MLRTITVLSLMVVFLNGCVAGQLVGKSPTVENDNFATVHIARPSGFAGCGVRMTIQLNHADFYELACGNHIAFRVPANKHVVVSQTTSTRPDHINLDPEQGKQYYLENDCNGFACWLAESSKSDFMNAANRCSEVTNVGF